MEQRRSHYTEPNQGHTLSRQLFDLLDSTEWPPLEPKRLGPSAARGNGYCFDRFTRQLYRYDFRTEFQHLSPDRSSDVPSSRNSNSLGSEESVSRGHHLVIDLYYQHERHSNRGATIDIQPNSIFVE